MAEWLSGKAY